LADPALRFGSGQTYRGQGMTDDPHQGERCGWAGSDPIYIQYHDGEWGRPVVDDNRLFEKLCLEGFQSGLSWLTILKKRERFRQVFHGFDIDRVALMNEADVERLVLDAGIIRHRGKITSVLNNARRAQEVRKEFGSLAHYLWRFEPHAQRPPASLAQIPAQTEVSKALSKDLRKRGWSFVGPTTCYAFMQAMGMVNDHVDGCFCQGESAALRGQLQRP
jgi:DNA-3-methyladenine glycosylase I